VQDAGVVARTSLAERWSGHALTSLELVLVWTGIGLLVYALRPARRRAGR